MRVRDATPSDAAAMADLLNAIIAIGGTTAHEEPMSAEAIRADYIEGPDVRTAVVAEEGGTLLGWQSVGHWRGEMHIGSFVRPGLQARGIGSAMFARTLDLARRQGLPAIVASIRADNVPGLAFYARMGFVDVAHDPGFALKDGTVVGRVHRRLVLDPPPAPGAPPAGAAPPPRRDPDPLPGRSLPQ